MSHVPRETPSLPSALELAGSDPTDQPDPDLLALPAPPRRERTLTILVLALATVAALAMAAALRRDVRYALTGRSPASLGDLLTASPATLAANENRLVRAEGMVGVAGGIQYERPFTEDTFRTLPVAGRPQVWVDLRVPAGEETGRWVPPRSFVGRLTRFDATGPRYRGLAGAIERATHEPVQDGAWLVLDGDDPANERWAVLLAVIFVGFAAWNVVAIARIVRRVT